MGRYSISTKGDPHRFADVAILWSREEEGDQFLPLTTGPGPILEQTGGKIRGKDERKVRAQQLKLGIVCGSNGLNPGQRVCCQGRSSTST